MSRYEGVEEPLPIEWRDDMNTGQDHIDLAHKELVDLVNAFEAAVLEDDVGGMPVKPLFRLREAAVRHFSHEEAVQRASGFPLASAHRREHEDLLAQLDGIIGRVGGTARGDRAGAMEIVEFLRAWVIDHVVMDDLRMKPFVEGS